MVDVKQAIASSFEFLGELYATNNLEDVLLEEVKVSKDQKYWLITLGFSRRVTQHGIDAILKSIRLKRSGLKCAFRRFKRTAFLQCIGLKCVFLERHVLPLRQCRYQVLSGLLPKCHGMLLIFMIAAQ